MPTSLRLLPTRLAARQQADTPGELSWHASTLLSVLAATTPFAGPALSPLGSEWALAAMLGRELTGDLAPSANGPGNDRHLWRLARDARASLRLLAAAGADVGVLHATAKQAKSPTPLIGIASQFHLACQKGGNWTASAEQLAGLRGARSPHWPGILAKVTQVVITCGCEFDGELLLLAGAIAASGRTCRIEFPAQLAGIIEQPGEPSFAPTGPFVATPIGAQEATEAIQYIDGMLSAVEQLDGQHDVDVAFVPNRKDQASKKVWQAQSAADLPKQLADQIRAALMAGTPPAQVAVVLPPSQTALWHRPTALARLTCELTAAGILWQSSLEAKFADTELGAVLLDLLQLSQAWALGGPSSRFALAPFGRLLAWLDAPGSDSAPAAALGAATATGPQRPVAWVGPPIAWPWSTDTDKATLAELASRMLARGGVRRDEAAAGAERAAHVLQQLVAPVAEAPTQAARLVALAAAAEALLGVRPQPEATLVGWQQCQIVLARAEAECMAALGCTLAPPQALTAIELGLKQVTLRTDSAVPGVSLMRPEDLVGASFAHVFVVAPNEQVWFRPQPASVLLPLAWQRALSRALGRPLCRAAKAQGAAPSPRERGSFLFDAALRAATEVAELCLLPAGDGHTAFEPAATALLAPHAAARLVPLLPARHELPFAEQPDLASLAAAAAYRGLGDAIAWPKGGAQALQRRWRPLQVRAHAAQLSVPVAEQLARWWLAKEHGATSLDALSQCRFRYAARYFWDLEAQSEYAPSGSPLERGSAVHRALYDVVAAWCARQSYWPRNMAEREHIVSEAHARFLSQQDSYLPHHATHQAMRAPFLQQMWQAVELQLRTLFVPGRPRDIYVEVAFGSQAPWPALAVAVGEGRYVRVRGAIDRIDVEDVVCRVFDYKTSAPQRKAGRHLQLGLYGLVAADHFAEGRPVELAWLPLTGDRAARSKAPPGAPRQAKNPPAQASDAPTKDAAQSDVLGEVQATLHGHVAPLLQGTLTPNPDQEGTCLYCRFSLLCGREEAGGQVTTSEAAGVEAQVNG